MLKVLAVVVDPYVLVTVANSYYLITKLMYHMGSRELKKSYICQNWFNVISDYFFVPILFILFLYLFYYVFSNI